MLSAGYFIIGLIDIAALIWALRLYRKHPSTALWLASAPLSLMWFDNITIALGSTLGEGQLLLAMNTIRFLAHYILLPFGFIAIGSMARQAGFGWAKPKWVTGLFCLLATYFIAHDLMLFSKATFYPSCFADTLRYTTHISEYTACGPEWQVGTGQRILPIPAILFSNMLVLFGIYLWWKIRYKWLCLGSVFAIALFAVPFDITGGVVGNIGEPIIISVVLLTAVHITKQFGSNKMAAAPAATT